MTARFALKKSSDGSEIELRAAMIAGKLDTSDIVLNEGLPSRRHARLTIEDGQLWVEDLESRNGTFVSGFRIAVRTKLYGGDKVRFDSEEFSVIAPPRAGAAGADQATVVRAMPAAKPAESTPTQRIEAPPPIQVPAPPAPAPVENVVAPPPPAPPPPRAPAAAAAPPAASPQASAMRSPLTPRDDKTVFEPRVPRSRTAGQGGVAHELVDVPTLMVAAGAVPAQRFELRPEKGAARKWSVGSDPDNDIVLASAQVSAKHAEIVLEQGKWLIVDKFSTNGTWVNDQSTMKRILISGDQLRFGPVVEGVFLLPGLFNFGAAAVPEAGQSPTGNRKLFLTAGVGFVLMAVAIFVVWRFLHW